VIPWILGYLKPGKNEVGMKRIDEDDDEYHLGEILIEFWETFDIDRIITVLLKFGRYSD